LASPAVLPRPLLLERTDLLPPPALTAVVDPPGRFALIAGADAASAQVAQAAHATQAVHAAQAAHASKSVVFSNGRRLTASSGSRESEGRGSRSGGAGGPGGSAGGSFVLRRASSVGAGRAQAAEPLLLSLAALDGLAEPQAPLAASVAGVLGCQQHPNQASLTDATDAAAEVVWATLPGATDVKGLVAELAAAAASAPTPSARFRGDRAMRGADKGSEAAEDSWWDVGSSSTEAEGGAAEGDGEESDGFCGLVLEASELRGAARPSILPGGVEVRYREAYLTRAEFQRLFCMSKRDFYRLAKWRRIELKRSTDLF
jgi:hypothetical protein